MPQRNLRVVEKENLHARDLARQRVAEWRSNAQKENLPLSNEHDDKGAPLLPVDEVLKRSEEDHLGKK